MPTPTHTHTHTQTHPHTHTGMQNTHAHTHTLRHACVTRTWQTNILIPMPRCHHLTTNTLQPIKSIHKQRFSSPAYDPMMGQTHCRGKNHLFSVLLSFLKRFFGCSTKGLVSPQALAPTFVSGFAQITLSRFSKSCMVLHTLRVASQLRVPFKVIESGDRPKCLFNFAGSLGSLARMGLQVSTGWLWLIKI